MWDAIRYVSGAASLLAFLVAAAVVIFRTRTAKEKALIQGAAEADRATLVEHVLETFLIDTTPLTKQQKHDLAIRQLDARMQRYRIAAGVVIALGVLTTALAALAMTRLSPGPDGPPIYRVRILVLDPSNMPVEDATVWSASGDELKKVAGGWEIEIPVASRPAGGKLIVYARRPDAFQVGTASVELGDCYMPSVTLQLKAEPTATVRGQVIDAQGAGVPNSRVGVVGYEDSFRDTDANGNFELPAHAADGQQVTIHVEKPGFSPVTTSRMAGSFPAVVKLMRQSDEGSK